MKGVEAAEIIGDLASQQWGLVTSAQAKESGIDLPSLSRLEQRGMFARIRHGVYASAAIAQSAVLELQAQWLALRPELMAADRINNPQLAAEAIVSHTTAAEMWGIGDLWPDGFHFTVRRRRRSRQIDVQFHRADLADSDWTVHPQSGLPITTVARTIYDLAQDGHEPGHLLALISDAGNKFLLDKQELIDVFSGFEDALGASKGDRQAFDALVKDYFPEVNDAQRINLRIEEALRPLQTQIAALAARLNTLAMVDLAVPPSIECQPRELQQTKLRGGTDRSEEKAFND